MVFFPIHPFISDLDLGISLFTSLFECSFNCDQRIIVDDKRESLQEEVKSPALYSKACLIGEEIGSSYA